MIRDKKILYRHIRMLQAFSIVYRSKVNCPSDVCIYEVCKLYKNCYGSTEKSIDFLLSDMPLPKIKIEDLGIFSVSLKVLTECDINQYLSQCKEYGIL